MIFRLYRGKQFLNISVLRVGFLTQFLGLMFSRRKTSIRLFFYRTDRCVPIHSWFVFYPFLIAWLDSRNRIIEWRVVKPFNSCVLPMKKCMAFLEIPIDEKYRSEIGFIVGKRQTFKYN